MYSPVLETTARDRKWSQDTTGFLLSFGNSKIAAALEAILSGCWNASMLGRTLERLDGGQLGVSQFWKCLIKIIKASTGF
jgi:hypothetical protein